MSIETLMHANLLDVFNERDGGKRHAAAERTYAPDVRWTHEEGAVTGRDVLEAKCVALQSKLGDLQFEADSPVRQVPGFGFLAWRLLDSNGSHQMSGFDAALIKGGLITDLWTVLIRPR